jgi:glycosyltransferase involved in cell wall biosynthesis
MKIVVIGTRGIPNIMGGVETHCEQLYPRIAAMGHDVTVIRRSTYVTPENKIDNYKRVRLLDLYTPRKKSFEAIIHTFLAVIKARQLHPDVLHVHAIGPAIMVPFARLLGMKVVMTNHGPDYDRDKWGKLAKFILKTGERLGSKYSNRVIVISQTIADIVANRYGRKDTDLIYNGVETPVKSKNTDYIQSLGLTPGQYIVALGRFVKEKGFHDLIEAYRRLGDTDYKLVIAGDADHEDEYSRTLKQMAHDTKGVVLTGFIRGEKLNQIMTNADLFVLPSYHEGLPIALLEALSYNLDVIVSDIPANTINCLQQTDFFKVGDVDSLTALLQGKLRAHAASTTSGREYDLSCYNWDYIAGQVADLYNQICNY